MLYYHLKVCRLLRKIILRTFPALYPVFLGMLGPEQEDETDKSSPPAICSSRKLKWAVKGLLLGQLLAFCNGFSGVLNQAITEQTSKSLPACQTALNYVFICLTYGIWQFHKNGLSLHFSVLGLKCLANAVIDVEAWYWIYKAYNLTSLTSVQSLDCLSIPVAIVISRVFLHKAYNKYQYGAIFISLLGVLLIVYSDYDPKDSSNIRGDVMCALGALLFGASTVCQEWIIEEVGMYEYMGTVCWYAILLSGVKVAALERDILLHKVIHQPKIWLLMLALAVSQFIFYSAMPIMLRYYGSGAATINILAADVYAAIAGVHIFNLTYDAVYIGGMGMTCLGIVVYTIMGDSVEEEDISDESSESLMNSCDQEDEAGTSADSCNLNMEQPTKEGT